MSSDRIDLYKELSEKEKNLEQFNRTNKRFKVDLEYIQESSAADPSNNLIIESSNNNINLVVGPEKTITLHGKVSIPGLLNINQLSIDGDASFNKSVYIREHLDMDGDASFNSSVDIANKLNVVSVFVSSDVSVNGNVNIGKSLTVDTLQVNSDVSIDGDVSLNSNVSILNNLDVDGKVSLNNEVDISENLYVNGDVSFQRNLDVSGSITATTIKVLSDISINGELDMSGIIFANSGIIHATQEVNAGVKSYIHKNDGTTSILSNFEALGDASFSAGVNISGGLMVGGHPSNDEIIFGNDVSFQRSVQIGYAPSYTGPSYTSNFKVYMDSSFGESVDISENLNVNNKLIVRDDVSLNNNVDVKGKLHIKNKLETDGDVSLNGDVDIGGRLNILGGIKMTYLSVEQIDVTNTLTVAGDVSLNANVKMANKLNVAGDVSLNSDVFMANKLNVDGNVSLGADVDVDENLTVARDLSVNLDIKVGNKMTVGGDVSLNASVDILTDLNVGNKLVVSNDVSLNKNVDITNNLNVGGNIVTIGNLQANDVTFADFSATNIIVNENVIEIGKDIDDTIPVKIGIGSYAGNVNQGDDGIAIGRQAGLTGQGANSISVGFKAGNTNQGANAIVIGSEAGFTSQKEKAISIGDKAGYNSQETNSIAIGSSSGYTSQAKDTVAIGNMAGNLTQQEGSVGMGYMAGKTNQGLKTVAVGYTAGESNQGNYAIAIGSSAGKTSQATKSIILNATGIELNGGNSGLYIDPIRTNVKPNIMQYDTTTKELVYSTRIDIPGTITSSDITCDTLTTNGLIDTQNNDINMGSGNIVCNTVTSEGLVITGDVDISDNLTVSGSIISRNSISSGYDTNTTSFLGRAAIGYTGLNDIASFSHIDSNTACRYGFSQKSNGRTSINAPTGEYITLGINNIPKVKLATDGKLGIGTTDPTSLLHVEGDVSLNLNADVAQNLNVYGDTYLVGKLDVESDVSFASSVTIRSGDISNVSIQANSYGGSGVVNDLGLVSTGSTKIATAGTIKDFQIGALDMSASHFVLINANTTDLANSDLSVVNLQDTSDAHFILINANTTDLANTDLSVVNLQDTSSAHFLLINANTTDLANTDLSIAHLVDTSNAHHDLIVANGTGTATKLANTDLSIVNLQDSSNAHFLLINANTTDLANTDLSIAHLVDTSNAHYDLIVANGTGTASNLANTDLSIAHLVDTSNAHYDLIVANGTGTATKLANTDLSIVNLQDTSDAHFTLINSNTTLLSATPGTAEASKAIITDSNTSIAGLTDIGITGQLTGPATFIIDPAAVGDNTGIVVIKGSLQVDGTTTTINSSILDISDHRIYLASNATNQTQTFGAGIEVYGNKTFTYQNGDIWESNIDISAAGITTTAFDVSTINTTGRVGINMNTPLEALDIYGTIRWGEEAGEQMTLPIDRGDNGQFLQTDGAGALTFATIDTITITDSNTNTSFPIVFNNESGGLLDDTGSFTYNPFTRIMTVDTMANVYGEDGPVSSGVFGHSSFTTMENSGFYQQSTGDTFVNAKPGQVINFNSGLMNTKMILDSTGNLGIGTIAPETKLHVDGNVLIGSVYTNTSKNWSSTTNIQMTLGGLHDAEYNRDNKVKLLITGYDNGDASDHDPVYPIFCEDENGNDDFFIMARDVNASANSLAYFGGDVGIGLTNPTKKLEVIGDISCSSEVHVTGRIGIKMNAPLEALDIYGTIKWGEEGEQMTLPYDRGGDGQFLKTDGNGTLSFAWIDTNTSITITDSTANTSFPIVFNNESGGLLDDTGSFTYNPSTGIMTVDTIANVYGEGGSATSAVFGHSSFTSTENSGFYQQSTGGTFVNAKPGQVINFNSGLNTKMIMTSGGSFGIGLTNPTKKLEVIGDISGSGEITSTGGVVAGFNTDISGIFGRANIGYIGHTDWAGFSHIDRSTPNNFALLQSTGGETVLNASLGQPVKFHINNTEKMRLQSDGNVGIGITSPIAKLDVDGVLLVRAYGATATQETKGIFFRNGTTPANYAASGLDYRYSLSIFPYDMNEENFTNGLSINADAGVSICTGSMTRQERFRVDQNGNVGIGLTNATKRLEVVGDISGSGAISAGKSKDVSAYIGYARIGFNGEWTSQASFGHEDVSAGSAAITQNSGGSTTIGTTGGGVGGKTGSLINFCGANSTIMMAHADDDGGRLGIGIDARYPTQKLEVGGNIKVSGNITAASMGRAIVGNYSNAAFANFGHKDLPGDNDYALMHHNLGTTYLNASLDQKIHFRINHVTKMILDSDGNIGIGLTNPTKLLEVNGDISASSISCGADADISCVFGYAKIGWVGTGMNTSASFAHSACADADNFAFAQTAEGSTYINSAGTTGPTESAQSIYFMVGLTSKMILNYDGELGLGTVTPKAAFHLNAASAGNTPAPSGTDCRGIFRIQGKNDNNVLDIGTITDSGGLDGTGGEGVWLQVADATDATQKRPLYVQPYGGYFGVGTGTAATLVAPLHVEGWISDYTTGLSWINLAEGTYTADENPTINTLPSGITIYASHGVMSGTGYFQGSDDRIKSFEVPLALGLDEIIQLEPKSYLKHPEFLVPVDDETGSTLPIDASGNLYKIEIDESGNNIKVPMYAESEYGLISQEMLLIPGMEILVTEDNTENKIKNVNYIGLIPILINGIKELKTITDTQAATIAALDSRLTASLDAQTALIATLTTRLNQLEA